MSAVRSSNDSMKVICTEYFWSHDQNEFSQYDGQFSDIESENKLLFRNKTIAIDKNDLALMPGYKYHTWNKITTGKKGTDTYRIYYPVPMGQDFYSAGLR